MLEQVMFNRIAMIGELPIQLELQRYSFHFKAHATVELPACKRFSEIELPYTKELLTKISGANIWNKGFVLV